MEMVIIGSGNVAFHLVKACILNNIPIKQIYGRNEERLASISAQFQIPYSTQSLAEATLYIIAVNDDAVQTVSKKIMNPNVLVAHTSGSLPKEILEGNFRKASFYPLQTFSKDKEIDYAKIPFLIEADNEQDTKYLMQLALKISKNVVESTFEKRKYMHLAAVFVSNFVNHLYARAKEISDSQDIPFSFFMPLIEETTEKIKYLSPKDAQTGPAVRNDQRILLAHEELLQGEPLKIYQILNESIQKMYEL